MYQLSKEEAESALKELAISKIRERIADSFKVDPRKLAEFLFEMQESKLGESGVGGENLASGPITFTYGELPKKKKA